MIGPVGHGSVSARKLIRPAIAACVTCPVADHVGVWDIIAGLLNLQAETLPGFEGAVRPVCVVGCIEGRRDLAGVQRVPDNQERRVDFSTEGRVGCIAGERVVVAAASASGSRLDAMLDTFLSLVIATGAVLPGFIAAELTQRGRGRRIERRAKHPAPCVVLCRFDQPDLELAHMAARTRPRGRKLAASPFRARRVVGPRPARDPCGTGIGY